MTTVLAVTSWLSLVAGCLAVLIGAAALTRQRARPWARHALVAALVATSLPLAVLALEFLTGSLGFFYVWENTRLDYPWWLRLAGLWGGQEGTFLLWAWMVLAATWIEDRFTGGKGPSWVHARLVLTVVATLLLVPPVLLGLGEATGALGLTAQGTFQAGASGPKPTDLRPLGEGLNPLLESPYMAIHPAVEFLSYGLAAVPFAYALVHLTRGGPWQERARAWAGAAWVSFALALALGSLWAYNVLSFGGYWAWDPVEVANLLPFLALTVFLHAAPVRERSGHLGLLAPAMATLAFVLVVLATFVTRSGLWSSVHAFLPTGTAIAIQEPGARLLSIVRTDLTARYTTGLLLAVAGAFTAGTSLYQARRHAGDEEVWRQGLWLGVAATVGFVALLGLITPEPVVWMLHRASVLLGLGHPLIGVLVLLLVGAAPVLAALVSAPDDLPLHPRTRAGQLVGSSYLLTLTLLSTLALLILGVNGYEASVFEARAPFLAAPILALAALAFLPGDLLHRAITVSAAVLVGLLALAFTASWAWAALPLALVTAAGPVHDLARKAHPTGGARLRARGGLLVVSGVLGLVHWTSPGSLTLAGVTLASPLWYVPLGVTGALLATVAPFLEDRGVPAWLAPACGVLAVGYGLGALAAATAFLLQRRGSQGPRARLRQAAVPMIHLGVALLVLGVAASTFGQSVTTFRQEQPLERGVPMEVGPYTLKLVDGALVNPDGDAIVDEIQAVVHVFRDGTFVSEETLGLKHSFNTGFTGRGSYAPTDSEVVRGWSGDLVLDADTTVPLSMRVRGTNVTWVVANSPPPQQLSGQVDAVSVGVAETPLVNLVWGSLPLILVGGALRVRLWQPRR